MNYHIMIQDKFLDSFIEDVYSIGAEDQNVFLFRGEKKDGGYIKTDKNVQFIGTNKENIKNRLKSIDPTDAIYIHWYDTWISDIVFDLPNKIHVMLYGGEFYCDPFWHHLWVYNKRTLGYLKNRNNYPKVKFTANPIELLKQIKNNLYFRYYTNKLFWKKKKSIGRIDYLLSPIVNDSVSPDYQKIKELYPNFNAKNIACFYDQNFDSALLTEKETEVNPDEIKVLLGNSADFSNNHLDAFEQLKNKDTIKIYCPLSYAADKDYVNFIIEKGSELFGERFVPITEFMNRQEYIAFINSMDVLLMYHNRQQGFGNICTAITLGKPVFLKSDNPVKGYMSTMGISIENAESFSKVNLIEIIHKTKVDLNTNRMALQAAFSKEKRLSDLRLALNNSN